MPMFLTCRKTTYVSGYSEGALFISPAEILPASFDTVPHSFDTVPHSILLEKLAATWLG